MSEDFRRKLKQYADGTLPDDEREEMEREIEKMEAYQTYLDELMDGSERAGTQAAGKKETDNPSAARKERSIIRRGKWKARVVNTVTVLALLLVITVISSVITGVYFGMGEPNRTAVYNDVVTSGIAVSRPNISVQLHGQGNAFFTMDLKGKMSKRVGDEDVIVGDLSLRFLLGLASSPQISWLDNSPDGNYTFYHPDVKQLSAERKEAERIDGGEWATLEKLPEGTVAEAYLSFDKLFETDDLLGRFANLNLQPLWFAADAGPASWRNDTGIVPYPIGFPYWPVWHVGDLKVDRVEERRTGWFGKIVSKGGSYPAVNAYGDGELRNENFVQSLHLLQSYKTIANRTVPFIDIDGSVDYIEKHGVKLYGAVVTGPVKELLKLRQESWIRNMRVGEVRLWKWSDRPHS
ncbi:anti-sigma factor [Paenibacillus sp. MBLB4367]|uniref:anti-sigma factor n=1 Tax=Paenibacillus sp. MBLB4367 TaxID=3384767 RepID=UPI0039083975